MTRAANGTLVHWLIHVLVIVLLASSPVPGVNESHYLPKAKHAWDGTYAPNDLFLESHDSHLLSTWIAGGLTTFLALSVVAWVGRFAAWSLFAWAWLRLTRSLYLSSWLSPFCLAAWYLACSHWHWAGEWAIGGFEGKAIAYPFVLLGIAEAARGNWKSGWVWLGGAVAWHPLVGAWAGLSMGLVWIVSQARREWKQQLPWLAIATALGLVGVVPALLGIGGGEQQGQVVASQVHVYLRLSHHLCPLTFPVERHWSAVVTGVALAIVTGLVAGVASARRQQFDAETSGSPSSLPLRPLGVVLAAAWCSVGFAVVGLLIDVFLSDPERSTYQPLLASKLLRFYWFRWADIAVPLAWTCGLAWLFSWLCGLPAKRHPELHMLVKLLAWTSCGLIVWIGARTLSRTWSDHVPPADRILVESVSPESGISPEQRLIDWMAVCAWIRDNTPRDSLWLTPKYQQTFKWYAARAEVVCWKDVPQDNASVLEWYRRITRLEPPRRMSSSGRAQVRGWTTQEIVELSEEFSFEWVLIDRSLYAEDEPPPLLEIAYPLDGIPNRSFAVFQVSR